MMRSSPTSSNLWYPFLRSLKKCFRALPGGGVYSGEKLEPGSESMKKGWRITACCLAVAAVAWGAREGLRPARARNSSDLAVEMGERRFIEPRLTGGFAYAPCEETAQSDRLILRAQCSSGPIPVGRQVTQHRVALQGRGQEPGDLQAGSVSLLAWPTDKAALEEAVRGLEQASRLKPADAHILSDLSAGYLLKAQEKEDPFDLILGLEAADRAVVANPSLPEARFNRALLLEKLFLPVEAWRAWQDYLHLDDRSGWADEARARADAAIRPSFEWGWEAKRARLEEAALRGDQGSVDEIIATEKQSAREYAEQNLLGLWAEAWTAGKSVAAARYLTIARAIGGALVRRGKDRLVEGSVASVDLATSRGDEYTLRLLAHGYEAYRKGYVLYKRYTTREALVVLSDARDALIQAGSPLAARAAFFIACGEDHLNHFAEAAAQVDRLWKASEGLSAPSLLGHITWMQGLTRFAQGDPVQAMGFYMRSLKFFQGVEEEENIASLNSLLAEALDHLGRNREAWVYRYNALRIGKRLRDPQLIYLTYIVASQAAFQQGRPVIGLHYQNELVRGIAASGNPTLLTDAFLWRGLMYEKAGDRHRALRDLARARGEVAHEEDSNIRRDLQADLSMIEGEIAIDTDPDRAVEMLTSAVEVYEGNHQFLSSMMAHRARAHAYRKAGDMDLAAADIRSGLEAYERLGENAPDEQLRLAFLARTKEMFDEAVSFEALVRRRPDLAFAYADYARTRVLPVAMAGFVATRLDKAGFMDSERGPLSLAQIQRALPAGTTLVQFRVLDDRVLIWMVRREVMESFESLVPIAQVRASIERARHSDGALEKLFDFLVAPWMSRLLPEERVVFAPDDILDNVPFSCLKNARTHRYFLEDHEIAVTPSASLYARAQGPESSRRASSYNRPGLVVGNPVVDQAQFGDLGDLPYAETEARRVAAAHPGSLLLLGKAATRSAIVKGLSQSSWLHFAGHAVVSQDQPLLSMLVLAPGVEGDPGVLYAREIYGLDLSSTHLVILSACSTAQESGSEEGTSNLARAFLAAGARSVVASLWRVDDRSAAELLVPFHEYLLLGEQPAQALRSAQLRLLREGATVSRVPSTWGAFEVIGAGAH